MFLYKYWQVNLLVNNSYNNCVMFTLPSSGLRKRKEKKTKAKRDKATYCYDRTAKKLPELKIWQEVRIALKIKKNHPWKLRPMQTDATLLANNTQQNFKTIANSWSQSQKKPQKPFSIFLYRFCFPLTSH